MPREIRVTLGDIGFHRLEELCGDRNLTFSDAVRRGLGLLDIADRMARDGVFLGTSRDREKLDTVIVTPLI